MGYTPILRAEYFGNVDAFMLLYEAGPNFSIVKVCTSILLNNFSKY